MIIFYSRESKLRSPRDVDSLLSVEFPDPELQPELHALVAKYMVHGPCGEHNTRAPYMGNGRCSKNFPKPFHNQTTLTDDAYATYRRRNDGRKYMVGGVEVDNSWVVPHCPWLLYRFQCHINVECHLCEVYQVHLQICVQ